MISHILELYARCGKSLSKNGLCEAVLPISEIETAIELFRKNKLVILGGDLYKKLPPNNFDTIYADWFYDGNNVEEGITEAEKYLLNFQDKQVFCKLYSKKLIK